MLSSWTADACACVPIADQLLGAACELLKSQDGHVDALGACDGRQLDEVDEVGLDGEQVVEYDERH